jgi:molybdopterin molybdotransferase
MSNATDLPSVAEAQAVVLAHAVPLPTRLLPLSSDLLGLILAEDVVSDVDSPPCDKAMMDGYAIRAGDLATGMAVLTVIEEVTAGRVPRLKLGPGQATRIMTGAPVPEGADAVVMVERSRLLDDSRVELRDQPHPGQHILFRGNEMRRDEKVLSSGTALQPQEVGLLALVGRAQVSVVPRPRVALLTTGDELVEPSQVPGPGQIRNSNGPLLAAQVVRAGGVPETLGIAPDRVDALRERVLRGFQADVLVLSGGVSAGKLDLVPGVLAEAGVQAHLHKVRLKPGKPFFLGTAARSDRAPLLVFGLPGNPVSSFVCFELFVRPALRRLAGHADVGPPTLTASLSADFVYRTDRPTYYPAVLQTSPEGRQVRALPWSGAADLRALGGANALLVLPAGDLRYVAGDCVTLIALTNMDSV